MTKPLALACERRIPGASRRVAAGTGSVKAPAPRYRLEAV